MMRRAVLLVALALAATTAACDSADDPAPAAPPATVAAQEQPAAEDTPAAEEAPAVPTVEACSLVSKAEAEKLAGLKLQDPVRSPDRCSYTAPPTGPTGQVEVYIGDGAKKQYDIDKELGHNLAPLSGIGDEAYSYQDGLSVFVNKGGVWTALHLVRLEDNMKYRPALEELARTMSTRY